MIHTREVLVYHTSLSKMLMSSNLEKCGPEQSVSQVTLLGARMVESSRRCWRRVGWLTWTVGGLTVTVGGENLEGIVGPLLAPSVEIALCPKPHE